MEIVVVINHKSIKSLVCLILFQIEFLFCSVKGRKVPYGMWLDLNTQVDKNVQLLDTYQSAVKYISET